jgi:DNA-binding CsgD family transcriptional regulator
MPRKREGNITESLEDLQALEARYRGKPEQMRVAVLRLLKERPDRSIDEIATLAGYSVPTVKRWWRAYRVGGVEGLLEFAGGGRSTSIDKELITLQQMLLAGDFKELSDVRSWIEAQVGLPEPQVNGRLSTKQIIKSSKTRRSGVHRADWREGEAKSPPDPVVEMDRLFKFLSSLPDTHTVKEWSDTFRTTLQAFLGDVDRISISINVRLDLFNPQGYRPDIIITQDVASGDRAVNALVESTAENRNENVHLERLLSSLRARKFPLASYQAPVCFVYYYRESAYLGMIVLWRDRTKPPISRRSIMLMEKLQSFITFLLSDFAARYQAAKPVEHVFDMALQRLTNERGLTIQERRITILQLLGLSYEEMATTLSISLNTVRYHLRSIYQKTGTHSLAELFAKYFTPRFDPDQPAE